MKIILTGSLGHIGKPLATELISKGHNVTIISSDEHKSADIEALGATAGIGTLEDAAFLTETFTGADAVYTMVPPNNYFDHSLDLIEYYRRLGRNFREAVASSGIERIVNLSSIGAHLAEGNGILRGAHDVEGILNTLPGAVAITHIRPTSFYYNLFGYIQMIKEQGFIAANYGGDDLMPWVSPIDIASAVAEELTSASSGRKVRYVASEECTCSETAAVLSQTIGKPNLQWKIVSDAETAGGLKAIGMNPQIADGLTEMYAALHTGLLAKDYFANRPQQMGKVKLRDFAQDFAAAYNG